MKFEKCMGTQKWALGFVYMRFGKCMGTIGGHIYEILDVYGGPWGSFI